MATDRLRQLGPTPLTVAVKATMPVFATAVVFSFFINLLMFVSPLYMLNIYDRVITSRNEKTLVGLTILAVVLIAIYAILEMLRSRILVRAGLRFDEFIAKPVFNAIHRGNLVHPAGGHVQCLRDVDSLREFLTGSGLIAFCDAPWFPVFVAAAFVLHPWFGYLAVGGSVLTIALTLLNEMVTRPQLNQASRAGAVASQSANATFRNGEVLQAMGMLDALRQRWANHHDTVLAWQAVASDRAGFIVALTKFLRIFLQTAILGVGAYLAIERETSPGAMIAASILIGRAMNPIELAVGNWRGFVNARDAYNRLKGLFGIAGAEPQRMPLPDPVGAVTVENAVVVPPAVTTRAKEQIAPVLRGVSLSVDVGETLAIIGPSASGKSSLARVLVGVWALRSGSVRLDGSDLSHWNSGNLGDHIGYLPQDVELFSGSIAQNIARFKDIDEGKVIAAAELAGCHEMIQLLPEGYNTSIGDGGSVLSGGQRQRVALARALYGSPCLVVLDEPNASLDSAGETALLNALQRLKQAKTTVVVITHKINVLSVADKILVMNNGSVQLFGMRDEVLAKMVGPRVVPTAPAVARSGTE